MSAVTSQDAGNEIATVLNNATTVVAQTTWSIAAWITATSTSTTTDFGSLKVGDRILVITAAGAWAATPQLTVATAGTLPAAAVATSLYLVFRAVTYPAVSAEKF
jgi:hypothetical protein